VTGTDASGPSRRSVLRLAGAGALVAATSLSGARLAFGAPRGADVLVVLSLRGGFDGLAAVAPIGDPRYERLRPMIATPARDAVRVDRTFGLHPAMAPRARRWDAGALAVVHAVGGPTSRSHTLARAEVERGGELDVRTGWIRRALAADRDPYAATQVGVPHLPAAVAGPGDPFAVSRLRNVRLVVKQADVPIAAWQDGFGELVRGPRGEVTRPIGTALTGVADLGRVSSGDAVEAGYPAGALGEALHDVARLVRADAGLRVATVDFGGWDLHAGAGRAGDGPMHDNLLELSRALAAFGAELDDDFGRVTLVTLTEFGRRAAENGSGGTDHGVAAAALVLGGTVRGGRVLGRWPGLADDQLVDGDLAVTTDHRSVLAEILGTRLGVTDLRGVFPGLTPKAVGVVRAP
jgi:uncharacterized protein (DUF1501 family)